MRYGPETAEEVVPPADAEPWAAGAPRLMAWMTPPPDFQAEADAVDAGADGPALATGAPFVLATGVVGGGS
jgi:hypothetical protein